MEQFSHTFLSTAVDGIKPPAGRWTSGPSLDGKGEYRVEHLWPMGGEPQLAPPIPQAFAQQEEQEAGQQRIANNGGRAGQAGSTSSEGIISRLAEGIHHVAEDLTGGRDA